MKRPDSTNSNVKQEKLAARIKHAAAKVGQPGVSQTSPGDILAFAQGIFWESKWPLSFTYVSPQAETILGYPIEDWSEPLFWENHLHPDDREYVFNAIERTVADLGTVELIYRMFTADGRILWLHELITVVCDNNQDLRLYGVTVDITNQKDMESELQQLKQMLQLVIDTIPDSIFWKNKQSVFLGCNRIFAQQAGLKSPADVIGKTDFDFPWTKEQLDLYREYDQEVIVFDKPVYHISETQVQTDGQVTWIDMNKLPLHDAQGHVIGVLGTYQNVTEQIEARKALEKHRNDLENAVRKRTNELWQLNQELNLLTTQLQAARDEALAASNIKSDFVANISHEMRTPLASIIGTAELLTGTMLDQEQLEHLENIQASADHLLTIINNILDLSKIEADKLELESIEFNPVTLLENTVALLGSAAQAKRLSLVSYINPLVPDTVTGDPVRLKQILLNLIANAIKFTPSGEVFARCETQESSMNMVTLRFSVQDTGIGIAPPTQGGLFQPFGQLDKTTTRRYGGTGLGLSICKKLVQLMAGEIGVTSNVNAGSTFWFTVRLPYKRTSAPFSQSWFYPTTEAMKNKRLLVYAATANSKDLLSSYLFYTKAQIQITTDLNEALQLIHRGQNGQGFDAAILEVNRTQDFMNQINAMYPQAVPAKNTVFLSSDITDEHLKNTNVLIKPFGRAQFLFATCKAAGLNAAEIEPLSRAIADRSTEAVPPLGLNPTVMLVEDNSVLQRLGKQQLAKLGVLAQPISNGEEALEELMRADYDLILMDCQMPGMDGWQVTQQIRSMEEQTGKHVPIIAMTASAMSGDREKCLLAGMDDYLSKPVRLQDLRRIISRWIN